MALSHLNGWRAVEAVLREGSVAGAARALSVSTAAVSAQIRGLEERLERPLFAREAGGLRPLPETAAEADRIGRAFALLAEVQDTLAGGRPEGQVAITTTMTFAETWLPRHMGDLFAAVGQLDLRIDTTWSVVDLRREPFDFAIRYMDDPGPEYGARALFPSGVVPVCTPEFAARYGLAPETHDLTEVPIIHNDVPTSDPDWCDWAAWAARCGRRLPARRAGRSYALQASGTRLARSGIGLVLGGLSEVMHAVAEGHLILPFGPDTVVPGSYRHRLIWLRDRRLGPAQRRVRDWVSDRAKDDRALMAELFGV